ncbi:MAG: hypothetical protein K9N06_13725 [Candidatus Cloacimonetes bacterium]|nr:hypothetical protein [Candidatus Cloacimonadota bacterium]
MAFLALSILCSVAIANLLTWFNKDKRIDIFYIFAGNYCVASLFSWSTNKIPVGEADFFDLGLGIVAGAFFLLNFLIYQHNIIKNGQSLAVGVMRVSLLIPTFLSILVFQERLLPVKYLGIIIIILSFAYLSFSGQVKSLFLALGLFLVTGITDSFMKLYDELGKAEPSLYIALLFTAALISTILLIIVRKRHFQMRSLAYGFLLGIPNQLTTKFFMESLTSVKAALAYPLLASGVVLLVITSDICFWKRKFNRRTLAAYAALIIGIMLLNIKW